MKTIIIYFILITTVFATKLIDGNYSVVENVVRGKKWRTKVDLRVKNNQVDWVDVDMVTKDGKLMSQDDKDLKVVLTDTGGINPYVELPKEYMKKLKVVDNYKMSRIDTIAGATAVCNKFNKMTVFLIKKSEEGKIGRFEGWFH
jgi:major membrane immunogen (membrane-anchored lipoprotein)